MATNDSVKIIKPAEPKPISKTTEKSSPDTFKPEFLDIKKTPWEILAARYRNVNTGR